VTSHPPTTVTATGGRTLFAEHLTAPLWWWPVSLVVLVPVAIEGHMALRGLPVWLAYVVLLPLPIWTLLWLGRQRIEVVTSSPDAEPNPADIELRVGRAHLPSNFIGRTTAVPAEAKSAALGRQLDPAAYVAHRAWIGPMALLVLRDPDDPTPYWLISTRKPTQLLAALGRPDA